MHFEIEKKNVFANKCLKKDNSSKQIKMLKVGLINTLNKFSLLILIGDKRLKISTGPFNEQSKYYMPMSQVVSEGKIF